MAGAQDIIDSATLAVTNLTEVVVEAGNALNDIAMNTVGYGWVPVNVGTADKPLDSAAVFGSDTYTTMQTLLNNAKVTLQSPYTSPNLSGLAMRDLPVEKDISGFDAPQWDSVTDTAWAATRTAINSFISNIGSSDDIATVLDKLTSDATRAENPIYQKEIERKQQALRDAYGAANAATGARGFTYPNIITVALKMKSQQDFQFSLNESARELVKYTMDWARESFRFSLERGISAHQTDIDFNMRFAHELQAAYAVQMQGVVDAYKAELLGLIGVAEFRLKELMHNLELTKAQAKLFTEQEDVVIKQYSAEVQDIVKRLEMGIEQEKSKVTTKIEAAKGSASACAAMAASSSQIALGVGQ